MVLLRVLFCAGIICIALPSVARAGGGVTITPAFQEIVIDRNAREVSFDIFVKNADGMPLSIRLGVLDVGQLNDSGGVALLGREVAEVERSYGLAGWLRLDRDVMLLGPNEQQVLKATIINQDSLSPGGHYAAVVGYNEADDTNESVIVKSAFSSLVFVKKEGGERYQLDLQRIVHTGNWLVLPKKISLHWHNGGNVHAVPRGVITVSDSIGRNVAKGIINESSLLVLPETFRTMMVPLRSLASVYLPGLYRLRVEYRYDGREEMSIHDEPILFVGWIGAIGVGSIIGLSGLATRRIMRSARKNKTL